MENNTKKEQKRCPKCASTEVYFFNEGRSVYCVICRITFQACLGCKAVAAYHSAFHGSVFCVSCNRIFKECPQCKKTKGYMERNSLKICSSCAKKNKRKKKKQKAERCACTNPTRAGRSRN